jgi:hypothetical protein
MFYDGLMKKLVQRRRSDPRPHRTCGLRGVRLGVESLEDRRLLSISPGLGAWGHGFGYAAFYGYGDSAWQSPSYSHSSSSSSTAAGTVTLRTRPGTSFYGQSVQLTANVSGATSGSVVFSDTFNGTTTQLDKSAITVSSNGFATFTINTLAIGSHSIVAQYTDSAGTTTSSTAVTETVKATPTHTTVVASGNPLVLAAGATTADVNFTATVSSGGGCGDASAQASVPTGTVTFTVTDKAGTATTDTETLDANGKATTSKPFSLAAVTYNVTVTYNGADNFASSSTGRPLIEQIVAADAVGAGSVQTTGTTDNAITLRGGQQVSIDATQTLTQDTNGNNVLSETGAGIIFVDSVHNINLTNVVITSIVFDPNNTLAQIVGTATNPGTDASATPLDVTFTMLVNMGNGGWRSEPSISMSITGTGINYQQAGRVSSGSVSVAPTTAGTVSVPSQGASLHDRALQSWMGDGDGPGSGFHGRHGRW